MKDLTDPTNRDSVPAILTPGEYVLNKEATEMYGPIIEQMNENGLAARTEGNMGVLSLNTGGSSLRPKARPEEFNVEYRAKKAADMARSKQKVYDLVAKELGVTPEQWEAYREGIAAIESQGEIAEGRDPYKAIGGFNKAYDGKFQLGSLAKEDAYDYLNISKKDQLDREGFRNDPALQEEMFAAFTIKNHHYTKSKKNAGPIYKALNPEQQLAVLGYGHNIGHVGLRDYINTGVVKNDGHGTPGDKFIHSISGRLRSEDNPLTLPSFGVGASPLYTQEIPQLEQPMSTPAVPTGIDNAVREAMRFDPAVDTQMTQRLSTPMDVPSAPTDMEIPYYPGDISTPEANVLPDNSQVIKLYGSNPELRNELYSVNSLYPTEEAPAKEADDGFSLFDSIGNAAANAWHSLMPRPSKMHVVPSVAGDVQRDLYHKDPSQYYGGTRELFNQGGPVQHLNPGGRAGGKKKVWDSLTQNYIWVGKEDPRYSNSAATPNIPVRPGQNQDLMPAQPYTYDPRPRTSSLADFVNQHNLTTPRRDFDVPPFVDSPPAPMSDEALLNTSSQVVEQREDSYPNNAQPGWRNLREGGQWQNPQAIPAPTPEDTPELERLRQNELLGDYARQFPEGDPRRAEAFNRQLHQKGAVHPVIPEDFTVPSDIPVVPSITEDYPPLQSGVGHGGITNLSMFDEQEIAALYDAGNPAAVAFVERQEELQLVSDALDKTNLDLAVANPSTVGYSVLKDRQVTLKDRIAELSTPDSFGNEVPLPTLKIPDARRSMNEVDSAPTIPEELGDYGGFGAVPGIDLDPVLTEDPRGPDQRQTVEPDVEPVADPSQVPEKIVAAENGNPHNVPTSDAAAVGAQAVSQNPAHESKAISAIKGFFGDLFTEDELKRAAVLFVGALLTGASPGQAFAFAGKDYISRGDAHNKYVQKLIEEGNHDVGSINKYSETKNIDDLVRKKVAPTRTGDLKTFWNKGTSKQVTAEKVKFGEEERWIDAATGKEVKLSDHYGKEDSWRVKGTSAYNDRFNKNASTFGKLVMDLQEADTSGKEGAPLTNFSETDVGLQVADFMAETMEQSPQDMNRVVKMALADLQSDLRGGADFKANITPYLHNQYVIVKSGHSNLFTLDSGQQMDSQRISKVLTSAYELQKGNPNDPVSDIMLIEHANRLFNMTSETVPPSTENMSWQTSWQSVVDVLKNKKERSITVEPGKPPSFYYKGNKTETAFYKFLTDLIKG
mgnify:CR=1 FL=1|jgi:hypothetical protein